MQEVPHFERGLIAILMNTLLSLNDHCKAASWASLLIIFVTYSSLPMHSYGLDGLESIIIFKYPTYIAYVPIAKVIMDYRTSNPLHG